MVVGDEERSRDLAPGEEAKFGLQLVVENWPEKPGEKVFAGALVEVLDRVRLAAEGGRVNVPFSMWVNMTEEALRGEFSDMNPDAPGVKDKLMQFKGFLSGEAIRTEALADRRK